MVKSALRGAESTPINAFIWLSNALTATARAARDTATRHKQLDVVLLLNEELNRLMRKPGLRTLPGVMRGPATAAGLSSLQCFLEAGFDASADMHGADDFLTTIRLREMILISALFDDNLVACETKLRNLLAALPSGGLI